MVSSLSNENLYPRKFWSLSKSVLGVHYDRVIPPTLKYNNCFISEDSEKAETFNQYFARQMSISNNIADLPTLPPFSYITDERLGSVDVNEADVLKYLRHVNYINLMVWTEYRITSSNSVSYTTVFGHE